MFVKYIQIFLFYPKYLFFYVIDTNLKNFDTHVGHYPSDRHDLCKTVSTIVKRPNNNDISQYECFPCDSISQGSFVTITLNTKGISLILCDVIVRGQFVKKRGFFLSFFFKLLIRVML